MKHLIYIIFAWPSVYIGRSNDAIERLRRGHHMIYADWAILEEVDESDVREAERKWAKTFLDLGCDLLNLDQNCDNPGRIRCSEDHRRKIGDALRGRKNGPLPEPTKAALRKVLAGREITWGDKISAAKFGHSVSPETRLKLRLARLGKTFPGRKRKEYCSRGHLRIPENLHRRACKLCEALMRKGTA